MIQSAVPTDGILLLHKRRVLFHIQHKRGLKAYLGDDQGFSFELAWPFIKDLSNSMSKSKHTGTLKINYIRFMPFAAKYVSNTELD